ncbi:hypothetical protein K432DRAFT_379806 [Lepidopterella palustris CBS 459.81]|uniref:Uncharacterized protein n=1 Tax=Lepidopterella palustris CBS 459.81 TaxID=1314670 RepID=A0A8E2EFZ0_9PEZI|nr:hypothetical protein K432DRAFT_379806 [Lepidopterella palustris CBS 459.81]
MAPHGLYSVPASSNRPCSGPQPTWAKDRVADALTCADDVAESGKDFMGSPAPPPTTKGYKDLLEVEGEHESGQPEPDTTHTFSSSAPYSSFSISYPQHQPQHNHPSGSETAGPKVTTHHGPTPKKTVHASAPRAGSAFTRFTAVGMMARVQRSHNGAEDTGSAQEGLRNRDEESTTPIDVDTTRPTHEQRRVQSVRSEPQPQPRENLLGGGLSSEDWINRAMRIVPGIPKPRPQPPVSAFIINPQDPNRVDQTTGLAPTPLPTPPQRRLRQRQNWEEPSALLARRTGVNVADVSTEMASTPAAMSLPQFLNSGQGNGSDAWDFDFDLPPFPTPLLALLMAGLIAGAVLAVVIYFVNFPPADAKRGKIGMWNWIQGKRSHGNKKDAMWTRGEKVKDNGGSDIGTASWTTSSAAARLLDGRVRSYSDGEGVHLRRMGRDARSSPFTPSSSSASPSRNVQAPFLRSTTHSPPSAISQPESTPSTPLLANWDDIPISHLPARSHPSSGPRPRPLHRPVPAPLDLSAMLLNQSTAHSSSRRVFYSPASLLPLHMGHSHRNKYRPRTSEEWLDERERFLPSETDRAAPDDERDSIGMSADLGVSEFDEEAQTPRTSPRSVFFQPNPLAWHLNAPTTNTPRMGRYPVNGAVAGVGWLERVDGAVNQVVDAVTRFTADEGGENGLLLPMRNDDE